MATPDQNVRAELGKQIRTMLGDGIIDLECDPEHIDLAISNAFDKFRQRSGNAVEESYGFLELQPEQNEYILPREVTSVREIFRRGVAGLSSGGGSYIDPFNLAYTNLYLLRSGDMGGLATYDLFSQYQETVGRLFGLSLNFSYNNATHKLTIMRKPTNHETILLWMYNERPEAIIWGDSFAKPWVRSWALAELKFMIGEARSMFGSLPGAQGGVSLNGDALKSDAQAIMDKLEEELKNYVDGTAPLGFVIG
jgi:hypothetical protein